MQVHNKQACDFTFLCSSSLVVTAGQSTDHKNVCMWDTLLPAKRSMVTSFACHEQHGSSAIVFAPLNQLLLTGGKKGEVYVFDMRQRTQRHKFQAHESAVKCMTLDPGEEFFVTGSADGDIKVIKYKKAINELCFLSSFETHDFAYYKCLNLVMLFLTLAILIDRFGALDQFMFFYIHSRVNIRVVHCLEILEWAFRVFTSMPLVGSTLVEPTDQ